MPRHDGEYIVPDRSSMFRSLQLAVSCLIFEAGESGEHACKAESIWPPERAWRYHFADEAVTNATLCIRHVGRIWQSSQRALANKFRIREMKVDGCGDRFLPTASLEQFKAEGMQHSRSMSSVKDFLLCDCLRHRLVMKANSSRACDCSCLRVLWLEVLIGCYHFAESTEGGDAEALSALPRWVFSGSLEG